MRVLIIADIHANWAALQAVHQAVPDFTECLVLGDLVDYGPTPREVLDWVRTHARWVIRGNHDHAVAQCVQPRGNGSGLKQLLREIRQQHWRQLTAEDLRYLARLPTQCQVRQGGQELLLLHATPRDPLGEYLSVDSLMWEEQVATLKANLVCVAHTHLPGQADWGPVRLLNPGSVGQPRDGNPAACYAVWDGQEITLHRVEYDLEGTLQAYAQIGLSRESLQTARHILEQGRLEAE